METIRANLNLQQLLQVQTGQIFQNYKLGKTEKQNSTTVKYAQQLSSELSQFGVLSIESKVRKFCIIQGLTMGLICDTIAIEPNI